MRIALFVNPIQFQKNQENVNFQNYFQRKTKPRGPRANNRINSPEVQVIASNGENLGIINTNKAISMAKEEGLDLIEIAPNAKPPVCKIIDMGKYKYEA